MLYTIAVFRKALFMIDVSVSSPSHMKKRITKQKYAMDLPHFCIKKLMPKMTSLDINIEFMTGLYTEDEIYGACFPCTDAKNPREFQIQIDSKLPLRRMLETVAHEMVHVKQYARNELQRGSEFKLEGTTVLTKTYDLWKGKRYNIEYWDSPWEIEAHGREVGLFIRWAEESGHSHKAWTYIKEQE